MGISRDSVQKLLLYLRPLMDGDSQRKGYLIRAFGTNHPVEHGLIWNLSTYNFIPLLVSKLVDFGDYGGKPAICVFLETIRDDVGEDVKLNIDELLEQITKELKKLPDANTVRLNVFQAPPKPEYYVDRPEVSRDLKQRLLLNGGTLVISAIHGLGSVGKSTLAAALAHDPDIQQHFCDGILWATLGQEPDVLSLLSSWVQSLGDYNPPSAP